MIVFSRQSVHAVAVILVALGVLTLSSLLWACNRGYEPVAASPATGYTDDIIEQRVRAVRVDFVCWNRQYSATGVILGSNHVMTSLHALPVGCPTSAIWITSYAGKHYRGYVSAVSRENDGLLLGVVSKQLKFPRVTHGGRPKAGDTVCFTAAHPKVRRACGVVGTVLSDGPLSVKFGAEAVRGNSGSGVYNEAGELVGLVAGSCSVPGCGYSAGPAMVDVLNTMEDW